MARIAGVDLPREKRVEIGLTYIYGIGLTTSQQIIAETGINPDTRVKDLSENDSKIVSMMLHTIGDLERISDHAVNIVEAAEEMHTKKIRFSEAAEKEVSVMTSALKEILDMSITSFMNGDIKLAKEVEPLEDVIDTLRAELKNRHIERLREGICTIELGFILQDLLTNFERVSDHCSNIAVCLIQIQENSLDTHEYINELKKLEKSEFMDEFNDYKAKYVLPD